MPKYSIITNSIRLLRLCIFFIIQRAAGFSEEATCGIGFDQTKCNKIFPNVGPIANRFLEMYVKMIQQREEDNSQQIEEA